MYKAVDVYLEKRKTRQYVGRLQKEKRNFVFRYDKDYLHIDNPIPLGPDLPVFQQKHSSLKLFPSFVDRIPSKQNPAYEEYCRSAGISASETNPLVLLATLGKKGPSSFICEPVIEEEIFSSGKLKRFRKDLKLSIREFSDLFDVSFSTIYRIENNKTSGKDSLKRIEVYFKSPQIALDKIKVTGVKLNQNKKDFVENFFKSQIIEINLPIGPFTVTTDDIKKCSPEQIVELIKLLSLFECEHYNIPQSNVHFSENISSKDGGQDGLVHWSQGPSYTNYFPDRYNCFQIKKGSITPGECKKEIGDKNNNLKTAVQNVIKNKGAYILCTTHPVSGVYLKAREEAIQEEIRNKGENPDLIKIKFYDANIIANWLNHFPPLAIWFLKEVCLRSIGPWISWQEWSRENSDYRSEFMYNAKLKDKKDSIYKILSEPRKVAHLAGVSGVGKTRLSLEAFRPTKEQPNLSYFVIYSSSENINDFHLRELKKTRAILIIDDCSIEKAEVFHKIALQEDSQLSVLTIGQEKQLTPLGNKQQVIDLNPDEEIVKKILSNTQDITDKYVDSKWLKLTSGFPLMAKLLNKLGPLYLLKDDITTIRKKLLWGMDPPDQIGESVIKACSLFDTICFSDDEWKKREFIIFDTVSQRGKKEAKYIAEKICTMDYDKFYAKVKYFKKKKIIQQQGRFIQLRPKPLAIWLAAELIQDTPPGSVMKWITDMSVDQEGLGLTGLRESFCKQFSYMNLSSEDQDLGELLCGGDGFFGKEEVLTTKWGSACLYHLAEVIPEIALKTLKKVFANKTVEELSPLSEARSHLVQTLQKLAIKKELYQDSAQLLLKFAEVEKESYNKFPSSDNPIGIFTNHFQIFLSGTEAEPDMKFQIIDKIQKDGSIKKKEIAIKALNAALPKNSYTGFSNDIMQTSKGELLQEWRPTTYVESWDYFRKALEYLVKFATKNENTELQDSAQKVIADNLNSIIEIKSLHNDVYRAVQSVILVRGTYWPEAIRNLENFIKCKSKKTSTEDIKKAQQILQILQPKKEDIKERLKLYVKEDSDLYDQDGAASTGQEIKYNKNFENLIKDFKNYLESEQERKITPIIYLLFHGKQSNTIPFAIEVSQKLENPEGLITLLLELIKQWKEHEDFDPSFLKGFLGGLNKSKPNIVQKVLDTMSEDKHLRALIISAYWSLTLKDQDIKRLIDIMNKQQVKIDADEFKSLAVGQKCESVSTKVIGQLMTLLIEKSVKHSCSALHIYNNYISSQSEKKEDLIPILYKLLTRRELLTHKETHKNRYLTMNSYYYKKAVSDILNSDYGKLFSDIFTSEVLNSKLSLFEFPIDDHSIKECFKKVMEKYPDTVLHTIINCNQNTFNMQNIFESILGGENSFGVGVFNASSSCTLNDQQLKKWCEKAPDKIPVFLARNRNLFSYDKEKARWSWSPFALFLFDKYGDRQDVTEAISINLHSFSWTGSVLQYFEGIKKALEELQNHKHKNVSEFCEKEINYLEKRIKHEKQKQKEREFGVW